jgi:hypothetical protein
MVLGAAFERELEAFTARPAPAGGEEVLADPHVGQHADLVLAVALACHHGEMGSDWGSWDPKPDPDNRSLVSQIPGDAWGFPPGSERPWSW